MPSTPVSSAAEPRIHVIHEKRNGARRSLTL